MVIFDKTILLIFYSWNVCLTKKDGRFTVSMILLQHEDSLCRKNKISDYDLSKPFSSILGDPLFH